MEQSNPSTDYFVLPAVREAGFSRIERCGFSDLPSPSELTGAAVIFVRYVPGAWARLIEEVRLKLRSLIYFLDDDLLDIRASTGTPLRYRYKLVRLAAWRAGWLRKQRAEIWVSTPYLLEKYAEWLPRLIRPAPLPGFQDVRRLFYHGTASHHSEIRWLRPVIEEALSRDARLAFEIIGGGDVYRLYRNLPRVNVIHPMKWPAYQAFLAMAGRHIGLAPQLDTPFNRARSYTKFFDITRCGAVGIYSRGSASASVVCHEVEGVVAPPDPEAWVQAILRLAKDEPWRQSLLRNAVEKVEILRTSAEHCYRSLFTGSIRGEHGED